MHTDQAETVQAFIGLGSNLGDREAHLREAVERLARHALISVTGVSPVYETKAHTLHPDDTAPDFLNAVVSVHTSLGADELLRALQEIERSAGRHKGAATPWAPRTLDLDLLLYGRQAIVAGNITVPHPRLGERRFVLMPLVDLQPDVFVSEPFGTTARVLLERCPDPDHPARTDIRLL